MKPTLTEADFARAAAALEVPVAAIKAVCKVEAPRGGFLPDGRPTILFERHKFSHYTMGVYDAAHPDISNRKAGGYKGGAAEHERLGRAAILERNAALMSASWGKFQIMGFNHVAAGFPTLQGFVNAMYESEGRQLDAFVSFVQKDRGGKVWAALKAAIPAAEWPNSWRKFAELYNGPAYAANDYDTKLAQAYKAAA